MLVVRGKLVLRDVRIKGQTVRLGDGAAVSARGSDVTLVRVVFESNTATHDGKVWRRHDRFSGKQLAARLSPGFGARLHQDLDIVADFAHPKGGAVFAHACNITIASSVFTARQRPPSLVRFLPVSQDLLELASGVWVLECGVCTSRGA